MIFNDMQLTLQSDFQEVEAQIQALQEVQKQILDKMQSVGSVESEIESAFAMLAKGLRHLKEVCPEQIDRVKQINLDLYDQEIPRLPEIEGAVEAVEDEELTDPVSPNPADDESDDITVSAVTVTSEEIEEALGGEPEIRIIPKSVESVESVEETEETEQEVEQPQETEDYPSAYEISKLGFSRLRKLAKSKDINAGGKVGAIAKRLQGSVDATELARLLAS